MKDHVFVIDDDSSARKGFVRLLRAAGYHVHAFESTNKFLETLDESPSGCILLDVRMPGMSEEELYNELLERGIDIRILVISADDTSETRKIAKKIDAKGFFRKPIDGNALIDAINWILKSSSKENNQKGAK